MKPNPTVIVAQTDTASATQLAQALRPHCRSVLLAKTADELRYAVPKHRADLVVADLEMLDLQRVRELRQEFGEVQIVCTHRVPDEELWAQSLEAGADDCCYNGDVDGILRAAFGQALARSRAA